MRKSAAVLASHMVCHREMFWTHLVLAPDRDIDSRPTSYTCDRGGATVAPREVEAGNPATLPASTSQARKTNAKNLSEPLITQKKRRIYYTIKLTEKDMQSLNA